MGHSSLDLYSDGFHSLYALHLCVSLLFRLFLPRVYCMSRETFRETREMTVPLRFEIYLERMLTQEF